MYSGSMMLGSQRLSVVTLGILSACVLPPSVAFVTNSAARWVSPSPLRHASFCFRDGSSGSTAAARRRSAYMSTSPDVPAAAAAEAMVGREDGSRDPYVTELPDSFEDSIVRMGRSTLQCMEEVCNVCTAVDQQQHTGERIVRTGTMMRRGVRSVVSEMVEYGRLARKRKKCVCFKNQYNAGCFEL